MNKSLIAIIGGLILIIVSWFVLGNSNNETQQVEMGTQLESQDIEMENSEAEVNEIEDEIEKELENIDDLESLELPEELE